MDINLGESRLIENPNQVYHDRTLFGRGTKDKPLKVRTTAVLPDQSGHAGEVLVTDGTTTSWQPVGDDVFTAAPADNLSASGSKVILTANENQAFGDVCYINADGEAQLGDATVIATASCIAMCTETVLANATATYLLQGFARKDAWAWTVGQPVYLSLTGTTTNTMTQTAPSATDEVVQILGIATHADRIYFNPSLSQVEIL